MSVTAGNREQAGLDAALEGRDLVQRSNVIGDIVPRARTENTERTGLDTGHFFGPEPNPTRPGKLPHSLTRDPTRPGSILI